MQEAKEKKIGKQVKTKKFFVCRDPTHNTKFRKRKVSKTVAIVCGGKKKNNKNIYIKNVANS